MDSPNGCVRTYVRSYYRPEKHTHLYMYGYIHQCCGHYRGIIINYHCDYLSIKALRLPLPLRTSTKVINYHCNYISTIAITITNYRYILGCLQKLLYLTEISYM